MRSGRQTILVLDGDLAIGTSPFGEERALTGSVPVRYKERVVGERIRPCGPPGPGAILKGVALSFQGESLAARPYPVKTESAGLAQQPLLPVSRPHFGHLVTLVYKSHSQGLQLLKRVSHRVADRDNQRPGTVARNISREGQTAGRPRFEVVARIAARGFGVRREDMKELLLSTRGEVFTLQNLHQLVDHRRLAVLPLPVEMFRRPVSGSSVALV